MSQSKGLGKILGSKRNKGRSGCGVLRNEQFGVLCSNIVTVVKLRKLSCTGHTA
jgi:hypothetical protein